MLSPADHGREDHEMTPMPEYVDVRGAARALACSTRTIRRMIARGLLRAVRLRGGRDLRIDVRDLAAALEPAGPGRAVRA